MSSDHPNIDDSDSSPLPSRSAWWKVLLRLFQFGLLNVYAAALLIAAWPNGKDFGALRPLHQASRDLFDTLKTRSASYVFSGKRGKWKRKSLCIVAVGTDSKGHHEDLYETYPNCEVPNVRIFEDTFYVLLMRTGNSREMKRFLGASKEQTKKELRQLQRSSSMDRVSRYFCNSNLVNHGSLTDLKRVDLLWQTEQIHYDTSEVRQDLLHAHAFDCQKNKRIRYPDSAYRAETAPGEGPYLVKKQRGKRTKRKTSGHRHRRKGGVQ